MENETFIHDAVRLFPWKFSQEQFMTVFPQNFRSVQKEMTDKLNSSLTGTDTVAAHQWNRVHIRHDLFKVNEAQ